MANAARLRQLLVADESSFGEYGETASSATWSKSLWVNGEPTITLTQPRIPDAGIVQRLAEKLPGHLGVRSAELTFTTYWGGHNTTSAGALTETDQQQLLGDALGGNDVAQVGGTVDATSTSTSLVYAGGESLIAGGVCRVGAKGDARADGQATVTSGASSPNTTLVALAANPNAGDALYACQLAYPDESAAAITKRFCWMSSTTNAQYMVFGCQLASVTFNIPMDGSDLPTITWTYNCAYWQRQARTFPDSLSATQPQCAPVAGGSFFINDVGTTTRVTKNIAEMTLTLDLGLQPVIGSGAVGTYQTVTAWQRTMFGASIEIKKPWESGDETTFDTANASLTYKHALFTANGIDGRSVGFYAPRLQPAGNRPSAVTVVNDQDYHTVLLECREGATTTNALTRSAVRIFSS